MSAPDDLSTTDVGPCYKSIFIRRPKEIDQTDEAAPDREAIGTVFTKRTPRIGNNGVMVPTYLFKPIYDRHANRAWAHWQENKEGERVGRPISYQELVKRTGVEFLPSLGM